METELEIQNKRKILMDKITKRVSEISAKDPELTKWSGMVAIYNEWLNSVVQGESKKEVKSKSK
jgi:hypothetical protein